MRPDHKVVTVECKMEDLLLAVLEVIGSQRLHDERYEGVGTGMLNQCPALWLMSLQDLSTPMHSSLNPWLWRSRSFNLSSHTSIAAAATPTVFPNMPNIHAIQPHVQIAPTVWMVHSVKIEETIVF